MSTSVLYCSNIIDFHGVWCDPPVGKHFEVASVFRCAPRLHSPPLTSLAWAALTWQFICIAVRENLLHCHTQETCRTPCKACYIYNTFLSMMIMTVCLFMPHFAFYFLQCRFNFMWRMLVLSSASVGPCLSLLCNKQCVLDSWTLWGNVVPSWSITPSWP